jgi:hypothetical protein
MNDDLHGQFKKFLYFCTIFVAVLSYIFGFNFTYVLENLALLYGDFAMDSYRRFLALIFKKH